MTETRKGQNTTRKPQVQIRVTIAGVTYEEVVSGPLVALQPKRGK